MHEQDFFSYATFESWGDSPYFGERADSVSSQVWLRERDKQDITILKSLLSECSPANVEIRKNNTT